MTIINLIKSNIWYFSAVFSNYIKEWWSVGGSCKHWNSRYGWKFLILQFFCLLNYNCSPWLSQGEDRPLYYQKRSRIGVGLLIIDKVTVATHHDWAETVCMLAAVEFRARPIDQNDTLVCLLVRHKLKRLLTIGWYHRPTFHIKIMRM
jgi:hypothetical protein